MNILKFIKIINHRKLLTNLGHLWPWTKNFWQCQWSMKKKKVPDIANENWHFEWWRILGVGRSAKVMTFHEAARHGHCSEGWAAAYLCYMLLLRGTLQLHHDPGPDKGVGQQQDDESADGTHQRHQARAARLQLARRCRRCLCCRNVSFVGDKCAASVRLHAGRTFSHPERPQTPAWSQNEWVEGEQRRVGLCGCACTWA